MRGKQAPKRQIKPDISYNNMYVAKFTNYLMQRGKKTVAQSVLYNALDIVAKKTSQDPLKVFDNAVKNVTPLMEVRGRRVGGANYQIPYPVKGNRRFFLAAHWLIEAASKRKGKPMREQLAAEIMDAAAGEGMAIKKKTDAHRMAESNRAFAHFARY